MATSMTNEEVGELLENERTLILATTRREGTPVMHALWFTYLEGAVYFNIQSSSFKYKNIQHDNRVCCLVEAGEKYFDLRGAMIEGQAELVEDSEERARVQAAADAKNARIGSGLEEMPAYFSKNRQQRLERGARVMIKVPLTRVRTWHFGKARDHYERASFRE
ncbi:MAG: pyridoxamine 5'-phosphate oxidase family protein [Myxococcales bacterium]|nr:pyridoxamine 5'-phosphate oxidase family protein [Myxococcales bacterium]